MRYWLVRLIDNAEPWEIMMFPKEVEKKELMDSINEFMTYFQSEEDYGLGMIQEEYVIARLEERYNAVTLPWDNEDNLYI